MSIEMFNDGQSAQNFMVEQGRNIESTIYRQRYPNIDYSKHVPVLTEGNPWAIGTMFRTLDQTGSAKVITAESTDLPMNDVTLDQGSSDFFMIGAGWGWTLEQINQAVFHQVNLPAEKAMAATKNLERLVFDCAMTGLAEKGLKGLVNSDLVQRQDAPGNGSGSTNLADKDVEQVLSDVNEVLSAIPRNSNEIENATALRLPPEAFRMLSTRRLGAGDGMTTILEYIRKNNVVTAQTGMPLDIGVIRQLETAAAGGRGRMMAYEKSRDAVRFHMPMVRKALAPWQSSQMSWQQGVIARIGGVEFLRPGSAAYMDLVS